MVIVRRKGSHTVRERVVAEFRVLQQLLYYTLFEKFNFAFLPHLRPQPHFDRGSETHVQWPA
jgi:hypothetical protein